MRALELDFASIAAGELVLAIVSADDVGIDIDV